MDGPVRLLVVDDDRLVRMDLAFTLNREGFAVDLASSAGEALRLLGERTYALVLSDIGLPDGNGIDILRAAKRSDPCIKFILLTGSQTAVTPESVAHEGAESLILKPFALADLLERVRLALGAPGGARGAQA